MAKVEAKLSLSLASRREDSGGWDAKIHAVLTWL
jgi:hypothetical protein